MYIVILITAKNTTQANTIANKLVKEELIACANMVKGVKSIFKWKGKVEKCDEVLLILKSKKNLLSKIIKTVKKHHSYDVPEIIALPIVDGNKDYLKWIGTSCKS